MGLKNEKECVDCRLTESAFHKCIFSDCPNGMNKDRFKKTNHGGSRIGAGRKSQYKEETQTISFRVPKSLIEHITKYVKRALEKSKK
jgi:hypothetical protein